MIFMMICRRRPIGGSSLAAQTCAGFESEFGDAGDGSALMGPASHIMQVELRDPPMRSIQLRYGD